MRILGAVVGQQEGIFAQSKRTVLAVRLAQSCKKKKKAAWPQNSSSRAASGGLTFLPNETMMTEGCAGESRRRAVGRRHRQARAVPAGRAPRRRRGLPEGGVAPSRAPYLNTRASATRRRRRPSRSPSGRCPRSAACAPPPVAPPAIV